MLSVIWQLKCSCFYTPKSIYFKKSPWKTRTISLGLSVKEACLDGASNLRVACVSLGFCGREGLSQDRSHLRNWLNRWCTPSNAMRQNGCFVKVQVGLVWGAVVWNGGSCDKMRVFLFDC